MITGYHVELVKFTFFNLCTYGTLYSVSDPNYFHADPDPTRQNIFLSGSGSRLLRQKKGFENIYLSTYKITNWSKQVLECHNNIVLFKRNFKNQNTGSYISKSRKSFNSTGSKSWKQRLDPDPELHDFFRIWIQTFEKSLDPCGSGSETLGAEDELDLKYTTIHTLLYIYVMVYNGLLDEKWRN